MTRRRNRYYVVVIEYGDGRGVDVKCFINPKQASIWVGMMRRKNPTGTFSDATLVTTLPRTK